MNNYQLAYYYPESKQNVCKVNIKNFNIDLNNKNTWYTDKPNNNEDPVWYNIKWGGWITNLEPDQSMYNKNCNRQFFNNNKHPNQYLKNINKDRLNFNLQSK